MSFLSNVTLQKLGPEIITPFSPENVEPCSIDFTLENVAASTVFRRELDQWDIYPFRRELDQWDIYPFRRELDQWDIYPQQRLLASTIERVDLPAHIGARVEGKSTWGRRGLFIHVTAGWIDAGFKGNITLELYSVAEEMITLHYGQKICQLAFFFLDQPANPAYNGKYQGQVGITEAR